MAYFKCTGGINPTGNAVAGDVKNGKTFSNANGIDLVGTFAAQEKTVTSSRSAQTVTPDSGKYLSKVTVNALAPTGTYTPTSRAANIDMGATSNYRYVTTTSVPNTNSGTYTYPANSTGGTVDLGATNTYRYVNAANVYAKGKADGTTGSRASGAQTISSSAVTITTGWQPSRVIVYSSNIPGNKGSISIYDSSISTSQFIELLITNTASGVQNTTVEYQNLPFTQYNFGTLQQVTSTGFVVNSAASFVSIPVHWVAIQ